MIVSHEAALKKLLMQVMSSWANTRHEEELQETTNSLRGRICAGRLQCCCNAWRLPRWLEGAPGNAMQSPLLPLSLPAGTPLPHPPVCINAPSFKLSQSQMFYHSLVQVRDSQTQTPRHCQVVNMSQKSQTAAI